MGLLDPFDAFSVGAFMFIFGLASVYLGGVSSFSNLPLEAGMAQFQLMWAPILNSASATGSIFVVMLAGLIYFVYFKWSYDWLGEAFWAAVIFSAIVVMLHA
jgi:hypothetical protein